jgi:hypothetical protein
LLIPLVTGASVGLLSGGYALGLAPLVIAAVALFWLRTPLENLAGSTPVRARTTGEIRLARNVVLILSIVSFGALIWLFWGGRNRSLLWLGAIVLTAFLAQAVLKRIRRKARTMAQMIGAAGLTATAPAAYYCVTGNWNNTVWSLWAANFLFAVNQIHFVQLRIQAARIQSKSEKLVMGRGFLAGQLGLSALLLCACALHLFGWYTAAAFAPILFRGFAWFAAKPRPLAVHALGKNELAYACLFGALLVAGIANHLFVP